MNRYEVTVRIRVDAEDVLEAEDRVRNQLNHVDIRRKGIGHWFWDGTMVRIGTSPFVQGRSVSAAAPRGWANTEYSAAPLTPEQVFTTTVLPTPPGWMVVGYPLREHNNYSHWIVRLGSVEGFRANLSRHKESGRVQFSWGCRTMENEAQAHGHWQPMTGRASRRSIDGGRVSYRAGELIAYAAACSKALGWDWHSAPASSGAQPRQDDAKEKDPLPPKPGWMTTTPRIAAHGGDDVVVDIGTVDGFDAAVAFDATVVGGDPNVCLHWGCRDIGSEAAARDHWILVNGRVVSSVSGEVRPYALLLIDYVVALCRHRGWSW
jgi:hypothetical protein